MKIEARTTESYELVMCEGCGESVAKRNAVGMKLGSGPQIWHCDKCVAAGAMDDAFAGLGATIRQLIAKSQADDARMG